MHFYKVTPVKSFRTANVNGYCQPHGNRMTAQRCASICYNRLPLFMIDWPPGIIIASFNKDLHQTFAPQNTLMRKYFWGKTSFKKYMLCADSILN